MSIAVLSSEAYAERLLASKRSGEGALHAFYEHRLRAITLDPKEMLIPVDDHLVHRGDGVFESLKAEDGRICLLDEHLARLDESGKGLGLDLPCGREELRAAVIAVAEASGRPHQSLRIIAGRGPGGLGIDPAESLTGSLYIISYRFTPKSDEYYARGLTACRSAVPAKGGAEAAIKSTNYIANMFMAREARERGVDLSVSFDADGCLAEAAVANICIVDEAGVLAVPEFTHSLKGTTIIRAMELAAREMPVKQRKIKAAEILTAREMLVMGTSIDCVGITAYEGRPVGGGKPGPVAARILALLREDLLKTGVPFSVSLKE